MASMIIGTGSALPKNVVKNADLAERLETSDAWIVERTGIKQRHVCSEGETTSTLATAAAKQALANANCAASDIGLIIVGTSSPDLSFPSVACQVQKALNIPVCPAFDVQAACSGFIYALTIANKMLDSGQKALVIGADTFSNLVDWEDRSTAVLFGDGAGAVVVEYTNTDEDRGFIGADLYADGQYVDFLKSSGGVATTGDAGHTMMNGREVFRHATRAMSGLVDSLLAKYHYDREDVDWLIPHQANKRIIDATAKHLGLPEEKVILTVAQHANTSAASIPLALHHAVTHGKLEKGQLLLLEAFGAGFTWGGVLLKW